VPVGSIVDLVVDLQRPVEREQVNEAFQAASEDGAMAGVLSYSEEPLVSSDIVRSPYSCIFDSELTMASGSLVKVFAWYDNEWGYSCRLVDLAGRL
jgi:glyceraldehyde 3-phosphate dehydrogenase